MEMSRRRSRASSSATARGISIAASAGLGSPTRLQVVRLVETPMPSKLADAHGTAEDNIFAVSSEGPQVMADFRVGGVAALPARRPRALSIAQPAAQAIAKQGQA